LVCGDIKNTVVSINLKEMRMFCEKVFAEYTEKDSKTAAPHENVTRGRNIGSEVA
jgi:hypothetical protein